LSADSIPLIPEIPDTLADAGRTGTLIPFVGSGVSCLAGCPDWNKFADGVLDQLIGSGKLSHAQRDQLQGVVPRVKLSLALSLKDEHGLKIDFRSLLHPHGWKEHPKGRQVYAALSKLANTFVTTNYDEWLDEDFSSPQLVVREGGGPAANAAPAKRTPLSKPSEFTAANLNLPNMVFHLHGSLEEPDQMIMTTQQYLKHYANDRRKSDDRENVVLSFLDILFANKNVLFVGYGLKELEILEYVVLKARRKSFEHEAQRPEAPKHFLLEGFFSHQYELMLFMKRYYRDCGIELLAFRKDESGHDQLLNVLENFATRLPASRLAILAEFSEMEDWINE